MLTKREKDLVEKGQQLALLDLLQQIESLYAYEGIPEDLKRIMDNCALDYGVYMYRMPLILLPLHPKWASLILDKVKTKECRLSFPSVVGPFKCLMYETKIDGGRGVVVGEFICDGKDDYPFDEDMRVPTPAYDGDPTCEEYGPTYWINGQQLAELCLTYDELFEYGKHRNLYGWNITQVREYDKPIPLSHFSRPNSFEPLTKPPQSYFEVWELVGDE